MQPKKLEQYKYFQPIAWTLCLLFAGFVTMLSIQLNATIQKLEHSSISIEDRIGNLENAVYNGSNSQ